MERRADGRAAALGYPLHSEQWAQYAEAYRMNDLARAWAGDDTASLASALARTYTATWNTQYLPIKLGDDLRAKVAWDTESDWHYYARSYRRPKNTYSNRRVEIHHRFEKKILTIPVESFRGEFLRTALLSAAQKLNLPQLIEKIRVCSTLAQSAKNYRAREEAELATPKPCYKVVARLENGRLVSIFDGVTEYKIGETVRDTPRTCPDYDDICGYGGIFVHATREKAEKQLFPDSSAAKNSPRITIRGEYWGKTNENGKIAAEFFRPLEII